MIRQIKTNDAPKADALLSQAVESNGLIFVAGQIHNRPDGTLIEGSVAEKLAQIMDNIKAILESAGTSLDKAVSATIYVTDMAQMPDFNNEYPRYFAEVLPARAAIGVQSLPLGATIEISMVVSV